jgi:hypothetical protein
LHHFNQKWCRGNGGLFLKKCWEVEIGKIVVQSQPRQKVSNTPISTNKPGLVAHVCKPSYMGGVGSSIVIWDSLGKKFKTLSEK